MQELWRYWKRRGEPTKTLLMAFESNMSNPGVLKCKLYDGGGGHVCGNCKGVGAVVGDFPRIECECNYGSPTCNWAGSVDLSKLKRY